MYVNKQEIKNWLDERKIINYSINEDLSVDVNGDILLRNYFFRGNFPVKFNVIYGDFICNFNEFPSTKFFPKEVHGDFSIFKSVYKNLNNFPTLVTGDIDIENNPNLKNIIGLWSCDFRGKIICCDEKWKEEVECYLISINRLKEVKINAVGAVEDL